MEELLPGKLQRAVQSQEQEKAVVGRAVHRLHDPRWGLSLSLILQKESRSFVSSNTLEVETGCFMLGMPLLLDSGLWSWRIHNDLFFNFLTPTAGSSRPGYASTLIAYLSRKRPPPPSADSSNKGRD